MLGQGGLEGDAVTTNHGLGERVGAWGHAKKYGISGGFSRTDLVMTEEDTFYVRSVSQHFMTLLSPKPHGLRGLSLRRLKV